MVHQVDLEVARLGSVVGDTLHGYSLGEGLGAGGRLARQTTGAGMVAGQDAAHSGGTDHVEVIEECRREVELTVSVEVLSHPDEIGGETLSTDVVEALGDDAQGTLYLRPIGAATLPVARLTSQWAIQQTDEALAV